MDEEKLKVALRELVEVSDRISERLDRVKQRARATAAVVRVLLQELPATDRLRVARTISLMAEHYDDASLTSTMSDEALAEYAQAIREFLELLGHPPVPPR